MQGYGSRAHETAVCFRDMSLPGSKDINDRVPGHTLYPPKGMAASKRLSAQEEKAVQNNGWIVSVMGRNPRPSIFREIRGIGQGHR